MSKLAYFDAFWQKKHDGVKGFALSLIDSKLFRKTWLDEDDPFSFDLWIKSIDIGSTLMMSIEIPFQDLSIPIFCFFLAETVDEIISNM